VAQRVQAGKDSPVDGLKADVALAAGRIERQKARQALTAARQNLAAAWGSHMPTFEKVTGDFYTVAEPRPLAEVTAALGENPDVARWQTEEDKRRAALRLEKARAVPDITVGGGVRRFEESDDAALVRGGVPLFGLRPVSVRPGESGEGRRRYEAARVKRRPPGRIRWRRQRS
jgi:cobalt-zinc-cadmium efflux system outer membrane protein